MGRLTLCAAAGGCSLGARLLVLTDSCHSGAWVSRAREQRVPNLAIQSACSSEEGTADVNSFLHEMIAHKFRRFTYKPDGRVRHPTAYISWEAGADQAMLPLGDDKKMQFWTA